MSHYKPYPAYKDSGVEWLGRVPEHWGIRSVKTLARLDGGAGFPDDEQGQSDNPIPFFKVAELASGLRYTANTVTEETAKRLGAKIFPPSTLVFAKVGAALLLNRRCLLEMPACLDNNMMALLPGAYESQWLYWVFSTLDMGLIVNPGAVPSINQEQVGNIRLGVPTTAEQKSISQRLGRETARIDALIEKKTRFIELLREKRQALITHAVTKGLDPNVKMKDSGVEWLGEVPEHWEALPLRRVVTAVKTGGTPSEEQPSPDADGLAWYTPGDFGNSLVLSSSEKRVSALAVSSGEAKVYPAGAVLVVSIGATLGKVGYLVEPASANQQINAVIPNSRLSGYFLAYSLSVKTEAMWFLANAATIGIMNQEKAKEIWLAVPSPSEQKAITDYLDKGTGRLDSLIGKTERSIELLKERRSALITAVVTGQIDLREAL
ncbi:restriction endonuclease subunit S [Pseudomonas aeruginosa]|uniref:restriction endonuclease subunit S n=1 Tax=Pseudomonas aeruginosa TaxID=287 RepID=UPI000F84A756|nr:restriction endonuclease subunit S [Pseudomonas aeruginosa]MDP5953787.1 restriction endonuclease subunit S [Pseudomonas aeruginosa]MDP5959194.1 restriction endonuclease subunit S [Pseudomonas aeruginosa]RTW82915.1 restriction endonuclease subunit S [Pseudomonas aeruginosa]RUD40285.1 restriction endonuclease subunit S [Pseudomonas aeruginosa]RUD56223.1 restriction endonuclease subunit S [Pseudomonas aeruginosa]